MLTPAISASSTSASLVIMPNAVSTHVFVPPFLYRLPLADEITTGLTLFGVITVGACPKSVAGAAAAATPAAVVVWTNSRRLSFFIDAPDRGHEEENTLGVFFVSFVPSWQEESSN